MGLPQLFADDAANEYFDSEPRRRKGRRGLSMRMTKDELVAQRIKNGDATKTAYKVADVLKRLKSPAR